MPHATPLLVILCALFATLTGCQPHTGSELARKGDEIVVCGRLFHTGAPVVLWTDSGGYDAYRTEKRYVAWDKAAWVAPAKPNAEPGTPNRYGIRFASSVGQPGCPISPDDFERIRGGGWDLTTLQRCVDQFVLHYDVCGTSRQCFRVLHDMRGLSVHFMLDIDGTIYQTLDLKERAWQATTSNDRSIGIEIANIGAYPPSDLSVLNQWYQPTPTRLSGDQPDGPASSVAWPIITIPPRLGDGGLRRPGTYGPDRPGPIVGQVQGRELAMYDLTPEQYDSLIKLTAALCTVFPRIPCDYPRDAEGNLVLDKLPDDALAAYTGILGHYHIQANKIDPGPALQWDRVVAGARRLVQPSRQ
ncbi:MAG: N-acetylmuramoyl-L-alanine amidase [Phycisphaerales bacterium]|nr:N-acetylmuramoyl-L-alanine amidase [Phycisphaerales bacterium]